MPFCLYGECENYTEGSTDYCGTHNHMMRKAKKDALKVQVMKPVKKVSEKQAKELIIFEVKKKKHLAEYPDCQVKLVGCKNNRTRNTVHHAGKRGKNLNNEEMFMTACVFCHDQIEFVMSTAERRAKGYLI